uniref:Uncharacterized protein n=1 Tax=Rhizophora mucronata TaxID=61149 RepID=A0A2P2R1Z9_RHIMU
MTLQSYMRSVINIYFCNSSNHNCGAACHHGIHMKQLTCKLRGHLKKIPNNKPSLST